MRSVGTPFYQHDEFQNIATGKYFPVSPHYQDM
jgi:hypothetical protein